MCLWIACGNGRASIIRECCLQCVSSARPGRRLPIDSRPSAWPACHKLTLTTRSPTIQRYNTGLGLGGGAGVCCFVGAREAASSVSTVERRRAVAEQPHYHSSEHQQRSTLLCMHAATAPWPVARIGLARPDPSPPPSSTRQHRATMSTAATLSVSPAPAPASAAPTAATTRHVLRTCVWTQRPYTMILTR